MRTSFRKYTAICFTKTSAGLFQGIENFFVYTKRWRFRIEPIFFNVENHIVMGYTPQQCVRNSLVSKCRQHHGTASALADSASLHLCVDFVFFRLNIGKNPLLTANKVRHSPFSHQIFAMQMTVAIQAGCVQKHRLSAKKE
jgi:hypothetical protein